MMKKKNYIVPIADLVVVDGNTDLLDIGDLTGGSKGTDANDAWGKHASPFETTGSDEGEGETDGTDWFNDNKSGW